MAPDPSVRPWGSTATKKIDDAIAATAANMSADNKFLPSTIPSTQMSSQDAIKMAQDAIAKAQAANTAKGKGVANNFGSVLGTNFDPNLLKPAPVASAMSDKQAADAYLKALSQKTWDEKMKIAQDIGAFKGLTPEQAAAAQVEGTGSWNQGVYSPPAAAPAAAPADDPVLETVQTLLNQPPPAGDEYYRPADMDETIRDLFGELQAKDLSQNIIDLISGRRTSLTNAQTRRDEQIGEIASGLTGDIGALETDRKAQQDALIAAIAGRAGGLTTGSEDRIAAARQALGPQVTDEFEQAAALASGLSSSQAASSQDAMSRLAQIANMAATERGAAPAQLAAESRLALGDEAFQILQGLNAEESERLLAEQLRQEEFNQTRDADMINALLGDEMRREQFLTDEAVRLQGQDWQADQALLDRDWRTGEREAGQTWQGGQAQLDRNFREGESALDRALRISEASLDRGQRDKFERQRRLESSRDFKFREEAFDADQDRLDAEIAAAASEEEAARLADNAAAEAEAAGSLAAATFYGLGGGNPEMGKILWDQMSASERKAVRDQWFADQDLLGASGDAGTYYNMVKKYGEDQSSLITLAEEMSKMNENEKEGFLEGLEEVNVMGAGKQLSTEDARLVAIYENEMTSANNAREAQKAADEAQAEAQRLAAEAAEAAKPSSGQSNLSESEMMDANLLPKNNLSESERFGMGTEDATVPKSTGEGITFEKGGYTSRDNLLEPKSGKQAPISMYEQNAAGIPITPNSWERGRPLYIDGYRDGKARWYYVDSRGQKVFDKRGAAKRTVGGEWDWVPEYTPLSTFDEFGN